MMSMDGEPCNREPTPEQHPELMTANQVGALLQINVRTLRRLVARKKFPKPIKVGSAHRWPRAVVDAWVDEQTARK